MNSNQDSNGQIVLFNGISIPDKFNGDVEVKRTQKPAGLAVKDGKPVLDKNGKQKKVASKDFTIVRPLPIKSSERKDGSTGPSITANHVDWDGQLVMGHEIELRRDLCAAVLSNLQQRMMKGEITFGHARHNNKNGNIGVQFKRVGVRVVGVVTQEQALKVLGMTPEQYANWKSVEEPKQLGQ